jgi:hypothetical protein
LMQKRSRFAGVVMRTLAARGPKLNVVTQHVVRTVPQRLKIMWVAVTIFNKNLFKFLVRLRNLTLNS